MGVRSTPAAARGQVDRQAAGPVRKRAMHMECMGCTRSSRRGPGTPSAFHASDAAIRSRLASRSLDLRRIFPAAAFADNAPPSTPGAARRGGKGSVSRCRRRPGRVRRGRAEAGQTWGREALAAHPAWSLVVRSSPSRAQRPPAPTTSQRPPQAAAFPRSLWLFQDLRTRGGGSNSCLVARGALLLAASRCLGVHGGLGSLIQSGLLRYGSAQVTRAQFGVLKRSLRHVVQTMTTASDAARHRQHSATPPPSPPARCLVSARPPIVSLTLRGEVSE